MYKKKKYLKASFLRRFVWFLLGCCVGLAYFFDLPQRAYCYSLALLEEKLIQRGLAYNDLMVTGYHQTKCEDIFKKIDIEEGECIFFVSLAHIHKALGTLPWVEHIAVRRELPGKICITLTERIPRFIWQQGQRLSLVDAKGKIIPVPLTKAFGTLPHFVGEKANEYADAFLKEIMVFPRLIQQMKWAQIVGKRRFDLVLKNGLHVQLPETKIKEALIKLTKYLDSAPEIVAKRIDLRIESKTFITPFVSKI